MCSVCICIEYVVVHGKRFLYNGVKCLLVFTADTGCQLISCASCVVFILEEKVQVIKTLETKCKFYMIKYIEKLMRCGIKFPIKLYSVQKTT